MLMRGASPDTLVPVAGNHGLAGETRRRTVGAGRAGRAGQGAGRLGHLKPHGERVSA